jgi:SOS-response transcriptional repressor LexA
MMKTRERVYLAILDHWREYVVPPVYLDIMAATGLRSKSTVSMHYDQLVKDGLIILVRGRPVPAEIWKLVKGV